MSGVEFWIRHVAVTDSTQDHVFRMARALKSPPPSGTVVVADRQSRGRGREGRTWLSPAGGLYVSILVHDADVAKLGPAVSSVPSPLHKLPLIAGLAVAELVAWAGGSAALKWPNDVMLGGRKLAGILCESKEGRVAIGIGINLLVAPLPTAACLAELYPDAAAMPGRDVILEHLLDAFHARLGRTDTAREVDARLWRKGETARHGGSTIIIQGVAESGALIAGTPHGVIEIISGEITFADDPADSPAMEA